MLSALVQAHAIEIVLIESALFDLCSSATNCFNAYQKSISLSR